jgi:hypothetical protein
MLLGPSYLSEKIAKGNIVVPLLVKVCQTSVTKFLVPPHFFSLAIFELFGRTFCHLATVTVTDIVADVHPDPYTENSAPQSCFLCACFFSLCSMKLETETKYYVSRILQNLLRYSQKVTFLRSVGSRFGTLWLLEN